MKRIQIVFQCLYPLSMYLRQVSFARGGGGQCHRPIISALIHFGEKNCFASLEAQSSVIWRQAAELCAQSGSECQEDSLTVGLAGLRVTCASVCVSVAKQIHFTDIFIFTGHFVRALLIHRVAHLDLTVCRAD